MCRREEAEGEDENWVAVITAWVPEGNALREKASKEVGRCHNCCLFVKKQDSAV